MYDRILVTGANGQIGSAINKLLGHKAIILTRTDLDLEQTQKIVRALEKYDCDVIINCAAYTNVDKAEEEKNLAQIINAEAPAIIADYAFRNNIIFVHYSTDYVFPGSGQIPWKEEDRTGPLNAYGKTKLSGEKNIIELTAKYNDPKWFIIRTSWVFAKEGKNFVNTMLRLGKEKEVISVVGDQFGSPTYAADIAQYTLNLLKICRNKTKFPSGVFHLCNAGFVNWHDFAEEIFRIALSAGVELEVKDVREIKTSEYPSPAIRPLNSRLDTTKISSILGSNLPTWRDSLVRCLTNKFEQ